jgi:tetratricopeptide (TPR) repeat protein
MSVPARPPSRTCPNGHSWQRLEEHSSELCPICGSSSLDDTAQQAETSPGVVDELPPPPRLTANPKVRDTIDRGTDLPYPDIPGYRIQSVLGRGGMGIVYLAQQDRPRRSVALKMTSWGWRSNPELLRRFENEAHAVAALKHPNIVQIFELGEHDTGPYFSIEYVAGGSLDDRLAKAPLSQQQAATILRDVALAVDHAHHHGIIHRDLKPTNILLTTDDMPKVSDFGLATDLSHDDQTVTGAVIGTPSYMAPEQAAGRRADIGPQTDVYALGAMGYEMLTGRPPFQGVTSLETLRQVQCTEPVPIRRLQPKTSRDLETICLQCLEKEPARRYSSAQDLADDLTRFLERRPICARPTHPMTRVWKWSRRRPAAAALIATTPLLVVAVFLASWVYFVQLRVERNSAVAAQQETKRHLELAMDSARRFKTQVAGLKLINVPGQEQVRIELLREALDFYADLETIRPADVDIQAERAGTLRQLGVVLVNTQAGDEGLRLLQDAVDLQASVCQQLPSNLKYQRALARAYNELGIALRADGQAEQAGAAWQAAIDIREFLLEEHADAKPRIHDLLRRELAQSLHNFGNLHRAARRFEPATSAYEKALGILRRLTDQHGDLSDYPGTTMFHNDEALTLESSGLVLADQQKFTDAVSTFESAREIRQKLIDVHPEVQEFRESLADTDHNIGVFQFRASALMEAASAFEKAIEQRQNLVRDYPLFVEHRLDLANSLMELSRVHRATNDQASAEEALQNAITLFEQLEPDFPHPTRILYNLCHAYSAYGMLQNAMENKKGGRENVERAVAHFDKLQQLRPDDLNFAIDRAGTYYNLGLVCRGQGDLERSIECHQEAVDAFANLIKQHPQDVELAGYYRLVRVGLATALAQHGDIESGLQICQDILTSGQKQLPYYDLASIYALAARAVNEQSELPEAQRQTRFVNFVARAVQLLENAAAHGHFKSARHFTHLNDDSDFDAIRNEQAFRDFLMKITPPDDSSPNSP